MTACIAANAGPATWSPLAVLGAEKRDFGMTYVARTCKSSHLAVEEENRYVSGKNL